MNTQTLIQIVGQENVLDSETVQTAYSKSISLMPAQVPGAVVRPQNSSQVKQIIQTAAETATPLITVSSAPPHFHGTTMPKTGGVVMDMSGMDRIKQINRRDRVAMVEPGIRFGTLQAALKKEGLRLPMPLVPHRDKSVVGSCLAREPHIMPKYHLDHSDPMLCNEVVFGTGDMFLTGEASGPGTIEEQWQVNRFQKISMDLQMNINRLIQGAQGTLGVVTWSTVKCETLPRIKRPFLAGDSNLSKLMELSHRLVRRRLATELFILNRVDFSRIFLADQADDAAGALPEFILFFCIEGYEVLPEERVAYQTKDITGIAQDLGVAFGESLPGISARQVMEIVEGTAQEGTDTPYWKLGTPGGCQDIPFISSFAALPQYYNVMAGKAAEHRFPLSRLGMHVQPVCQGHGHHCEFSLFFNPEDPEDLRRTEALYLSAVKALMDRGAFFSRPFDLVSDMVVNRDAAFKTAYQKLKKIFDPHHILNPGTLGC